MNRARALAPLLAAALCGIGSLSGAGLADPLQRWQVAPGTTGMLVEDHRSAIVSVRVELGAGTYSPWVERSHAQEAFELQMRDPAGALRRRADELAVDLELSTTARASTLRLTCRKEDLASALSLVRDVLANRDFDRADLKRRGREASFGWDASLKEPQFVLWQAGTRLLYREQDPRRRAYEKPATISTDAAKLAAARDLLLRLPGRVIGFAGDLDLDEARRHALGLLPPIGAEPSDLRPVFGPIASGTERPRERVVKLLRLTQVYYAYARDSLSYADPEHAACLIANEVLGGHFNSRLMVALRQEGGETYGAGSFDGASIEPGSYGLYTFTRTENAATTEQKFRAVLEKFHAQGISEEERADAAGYLLGRRAFDRESPDQILATAIEEERLGLPRGFFDDAAEKAAAVPLEQVNAFISRFYDPEQFTLLKLEAK